MVSFSDSCGNGVAVHVEGRFPSSIMFGLRDNYRIVTDNNHLMVFILPGVRRKGRAY